LLFFFCDIDGERGVHVAAITHSVRQLRFTTFSTDGIINRLERMMAPAGTSATFRCLFYWKHNNSNSLLNKDLHLHTPENEQLTPSGHTSPVGSEFQNLDNNNTFVKGISDLHYNREVGNSISIPGSSMYNLIRELFITALNA
jgi:hypothetical protein